MKKILPIIIAIIALSLALSGNASALRGNNDDLLKLSLARGVHKCYNAGSAYIKGSGVTKAQFDSQGSGGILSILGTNESGIVFVPTDIANTINNSGTTGISCKETFIGRNQLMAIAKT